MPVLRPCVTVLMLLAAILLPRSAYGQDKNSTHDLIAKLLDMPAPPPDWRSQAAARNEHLPATQRDWFDGTPPDDARTDVLLAYWAHQGELYRPEEDQPMPSMPVRRRLLDACAAYPRRLPAVLRYLPDEQGTYDRVKKWLDAERESPKYGMRWQDEVHRWLMLNSPYFRTELVESASSPAPDMLDCYPHDAPLRALARLDWPAAQPVLAKHIRGDDPRLAALALAISYEHAVEADDIELMPPQRSALKAIVEDKDAPACARDCALNALFVGTWPGRDEWYLSLFGDRTLFRFAEGPGIYMLLKRPVRAQPDKWIPRIVPLVNNSDPSIHNAAVSCLIQFSLDEARKDALEPLLPFLTDPNWAWVPDSHYRLQLVQSMDRVDLPECVPGLLWIAQRATGSQLCAAAEGLAHYGVREAVPILKAALEREQDESHRMKIVEAIMQLDGLTDDEVVAAVEAYARETLTPRANERVERATRRWRRESALRVDVSLGRHLSRSSKSGDDAAQVLCWRIESLREHEPAVARRLEEAVIGWPGKAIDGYLVEQIERGTATTGVIEEALERRRTLRETLEGRLRSIAEGRGLRAGIAAAILGGQQIIRAVLGADDPAGQMALLACARLARLELPVDLLRQLMYSADARVAHAAELYLSGQSTREARELLFSKHPNEALVVGFHVLPASGGLCPRKPYEQWEAELQREILSEDGPSEIFGLGLRDRYIIRIRGTSADFWHYRGDVHRHRRLSHDELTGFRAFTDKHGVDDLAPLQACGCSSSSCPSEYLHLTRAGGARVFMYNPGCCGSGGSVYEQLVMLFQAFAETGDFETHYALAERIEGLQPLLFDERTPVRSVWKRGDDTRVLVGYGYYTDPSWRSFRNGRLGSEVPQPEDCPVLDLHTDVPEGMDFEEHENKRWWRAQMKQGTVRVLRRGGEQGLWLCKQGVRPRRVVSGMYDSPVATADGRWIVALRRDGNRADGPYHIIIVDLELGQEKKSDVSVAYPVAFVAAHDRVLVLRWRYSREQVNALGTEKSEYRLIDPATGKSTVVTGDFWPLGQQEDRPLQATGRPNEYWAAIHDEDSSSTEIGRYATRTFSFSPVMTVPELRFTSMHMWVDEPEGQVYLVHGGHLLRIPFKQTVANE